MDAVRWYARRSQTRAAGFRRDVERAFELIAERPDFWPPSEPGYRHYILNRFPYAVIYTIHTNRVFVVAIAHGSRQPGYWLDRIE